MFEFPLLAFVIAVPAGGHCGHHVPVKSSKSAFLVKVVGAPESVNAEVSLGLEADTTLMVIVLEV